MPYDWMLYTAIIGTVLAVVLAVLFSFMGDDKAEKGMAGALGFVWSGVLFFNIWFWGWIFYVAVHFIGKEW